MSGFDRARERAFPEPKLAQDGTLYEVDASINQVPAYDPLTREHLWVVAPVFRVDAAHVLALDNAVLDIDKILRVNFPMCWYCTQRATADRVQEPCPGDDPTMGAST